MSWHYTSAGQQVGPVDEARLQELFQAGTVQADTLVWRSGMEGWKPYNTVFLGAQPAARYGGFWIRVVASIIDGIILGIVGSIVQFPIFLGMGRSAFPPGVFQGRPEAFDPAAFSAMMGMMSASWGISIVLAGAYYTLFVALKGATPGKMAMGLKVIRADGQPLSVGLALGRWAASYLSMFTLGIGFIIAAFDAQKRTLHDHICDTRVVKISR